MKRFLIVSGTLISVLSTGFPTYAQTTLKLYPAHGQTLDFRRTGQKVRKVWLDDPSQVTIDFDDANCLAANPQTPCAANVMHLRRIKPIPFPNLPTANTTLLTVVTDRSLYRFQLTFPNSGRPIRQQKLRRTLK